MNGRRPSQDSLPSHLLVLTGRIYLLPLSVSVLLPTTFVTSYIISVVLRHVEPGFPYISDTGTHSPESCIFGQMLNICAFLVAATIYVRYKQVQAYHVKYTLGARVNRLNTISVILGLIASFGLSLVANFQETNVIVVHMAGAMLCFGLGTIYLWLQTSLSCLAAPLINKRPMACFRITLSIICTLALLTCLTAGPASMTLFHGKDKTKWYPEDGGYELHVMSTGAEWLLAISFDIFILTFVREFRRITVTTPQAHVLNGQHTPFAVEGSLETGGSRITV